MELARHITFELDSGRCDALMNAAVNALRHYESQCATCHTDPDDVILNIPLLIHGDDYIPTTEELVMNTPIGSMDIGWWWLLVLGVYLVNSPATIRAGYEFSEMLEMSGWDRTDAQLVVNGYRNYQLLKPNAEPWLLPISDATPYWHCVELRRAYSGWLPHPEVVRLRRVRPLLRVVAETFDCRRLPVVVSDDPVVIESYRDSLIEAGHVVDSILAAAEESGDGIFVSTIRYR